MSTMKKTKGRRKVEMTKMEKQCNLHVAFSKRRVGLFKKASELCTLCGAEVAIILFSPGRKPFSFGHPSVQTLVDRFLEVPPPSTANSDTHKIIEADRNATVGELTTELTQVLDALGIERKRGEEMGKRMIESRPKESWFEGPIEVMDTSKLELFKNALVELKTKVADRTSEKLWLHL